MATADVTILGARPYGLADAVHPRQIKRLELRVFGEPMDFWKSHMPEGKLLRSPVDRRKISKIERDPGGFRLTLNDGEQFLSRRVVIAAGVGSFARRPEQFQNLPKEVVTHVSDPAWNFGPLMFLVCGADCAAGRLARFMTTTMSRNRSE